ncbi:MAG: hypothetical protein COA79_25915 [Planctomycetota bacterium]|nr:MAG: hypothetical protein COA79_25915 [Planctomycetota bacterium]
MSQEDAIIYDRWNYNGEFNLLASERDLMIKALNKRKTLKAASVALGISERNLYLRKIRHRITKAWGIYLSANIWPEENFKKRA